MYHLFSSSMHTDNDTMQAGFTGYHGGIAALQANNSFPSSVIQRKAQKKGILHIGGKYNKEVQQFNYTHFVHPIVKNAVLNGAQRLVYMLTENSQAHGSRYYAPNAAMVGTHDDVVDYLCDYTVQKPAVGVYYYHCDPSLWRSETDKQTPVKVYLDIDAKFPGEGNGFDVTFREVQKAIDLVDASLSLMMTDEEALKFPLTSAICYNERAGKVNGQTICSYHVTWTHHVFNSQREQKDFITETLKGKVKGVDFKVYSNGRLMRIPFTGKQGDSAAILRPIEAVYDDVNDLWSYQHTADHLDAAIFRRFNICPYMWEQDDYMFHSYVKTGMKQRDVIKTVGSQAGGTRVYDPTINVQRSRDIIQFFEPIMTSVIITRIQQHRAQMLATKYKEADTRAGVPTTNFKVTPLQLGWRTGCYTFNVIGDTFCEFDSGGNTPYYHEDEHKKKIQINFIQGYYTQMCYKCLAGRAGDDAHKWSIFGFSSIGISPYKKDTSSRFLDLYKERAGIMYLDYFRDDIVYNPSISQEFFVYHESSKTWRCLDQTLHTKRLDMQKRYIQYRLAFFDDEDEYRRQKLERKIEEGECKADALEKHKAKAKTARDRLFKLEPFHTQPLNFIKDLQAKYEYSAGNDDCDMDVYPHLVPMRDGTCYDVFSDCNVPIEKDMRVSSCLNANIRLTFDQDCRDVKDWFLEVAMGRKDLATYLKRVIALCMTRLKIDRKFYCNLGKEGRNGKTVLFEFLQVHTRICYFLFILFINKLNGYIYREGYTSPIYTIFCLFCLFCL